MNILANCFNTRLLYCLSAAVCLGVCGCRKEESAPVAPPEVEVAPVVQRDEPIFREWVGTMDGLVNATIRAQVSGYLIKQHYQEGGTITNGQLLFEIDDRTFVATVDRCRAQWEQAKAQQVKAKQDVDRYTPLAETDAISKQELDDAIQANLAAIAAVDSAAAQLRQAELDLGFTKITAPIAGIAGIAQAQIGDLVGPTSGDLTSVSTVDPIKVYFPVSEQEFYYAAQKSVARGHKLGKGGDTQLELQVILADGTAYEHKGHVALSDRQVDVKTGTIKLAGLFPNPDNLLRPGMFARIKALVEERKGALLIPQRAVVEMQGRYLVVVVNPDNTVRYQAVKMGERVGMDWIVEGGLKAGDKVVAEGTMKAVKEGMTIVPKPYNPNASQGGAAGAQAPAAKPAQAPVEEKKP